MFIEPPLLLIIFIDDAMPIPGRLTPFEDIKLLRLFLISPLKVLRITINKLLLF